MAEILGLRWREIRNGQIYLPGEWNTPDRRWTDEGHPRGMGDGGEAGTFASHQKMAGTDDCTLMAIMGHSEC